MNAYTVGCLTEEVIARILAGQITQAEAEAILNHTCRCEVCRRDLVLARAKAKKAMEKS